MRRIDSIKKSSLELFLKTGYYGTSIRDICKVEGIKNATLYTYFKSKGDLLLQILDDCQNIYLATLQIYIKENDFVHNTSEQNLYNFFKMNLGLYREHTQEYLFLFRMNLYRMTDVNDEILEKVLIWRRQIDAVFNSICTSQNADYKADDFTLEELSLAFFSFINYYVILSADYKKNDNDAQLQKLWDLFWNGASSVLNNINK